MENLGSHYLHRRSHSDCLRQPRRLEGRTNTICHEMAHTLHTATRHHEVVDDSVAQGESSADFMGTSALWLTTSLRMRGSPSRTTARHGHVTCRTSCPPPTLIVADILPEAASQTSTASSPTQRAHPYWAVGRRHYVGLRTHSSKQHTRVCTFKAFEWGNTSSNDFQVPT